MATDADADRQRALLIPLAACQTTISWTISTSSV